MGNILTKHRSFWVCLTLMLITTAVFYQVYTYDFINYDDPNYICKNPNIQAGFTPKAIKWAFSTDLVSNWHPLTWLSYMLDWQMFGPKPAGYHLTNLIFHIANTLLLFIVLKQMTHRLWPSAFVAALFALHPLHVESVAWVAERKDVLSTFFWMLTMWAYVRFVGRPKISSYLLVVIFFALGLMAKPMLVTLPFVLLLLDYWPLERFSLKRGEAGAKYSLSYLLIEKVPLFVMTLASCIVTFAIQQKGGALVQITLKLRISNALVSYVEYIEKMIWPVHLAMFYPHPGQNVSIPYAIISAVFLLAVTILILRFAADHRYLITGWLWYIGTLVPVIGLIQVGEQAIADRYSYITLTGLFIIIAWGLPELLGKWPHREIVLWVSSLIVLSALAVCAHLQQRYWENTLTLCEHAIKVTDNNYQAHFCMAHTLLEQGRIEEAIRHGTEGIRINPNHANAIDNLGVALCRAGRIDEAIYYFKRALEIKPSLADAHFNLAVILTTKGELDEAVSHYRIALETMDTIPLHRSLGYALLKLGRFEEAVAEYSKVLSAMPNDKDVLNELGYALTQAGKLDEAIKCFTEVIYLDPNSAKTHYYLGQVLAQRGKIDEAITHFEETIRLEPNWVEPMKELAWFLAARKETTIHNPDKAIKLAQRACELTNYKQPDFLDTLAMAYAATGDFSKAIETAEKALELCQSSEQNTLKKEIESRLALYKAGKPYIETQ